MTAHVLDGPSAEVVHGATPRAVLRCQRISERVLIENEGGPS